MNVASAQESQEVNVLHVVNTTCAMYPVHVAKELGFFDKLGLKVNMVSSDTSVPFAAFLENGQADLVMLDSAQVLQMANAGQKASVVYELFHRAPEGIAVRAESPLNDIADLQGKAVGLGSDRDQILMDIVLASVGMDRSSAKTVVTGQSVPIIAKALLDGTIDAFAGGSNVRAKIAAAGVPLRDIMPFQFSDNPGNNFVIADARKEELRPIVESYLRGWSMGALAGLIDTKAVMSMCRKFFPEEWEDVEVGQEWMNRVIYQLLLSRSRLIGEVRPWVWESLQKPYEELGEISGHIDPATFLDTSFQEPANEFTTQEVAEAVAKWKLENAEILIP